MTTLLDPLSNHSKSTSIKNAPQITYLKVNNYRTLKDLEMRDITRICVLLGPNGSGKSTVFDVFGFLSECFNEGLRRAWDRRGRFKELRSKGEVGPIIIELKYRESPKQPIITYHLAIDEVNGVPVVTEEWLAWRRNVRYGKPYKFLNYSMGEGTAIAGDTPELGDERIKIPLRSPDLLAVNTLGQFAEHPRVAALREFITGWYVSYLSADSARGIPESGVQERLSRSGDNLANVMQYLNEQHPETLIAILDKLSNRIPKLEKVLTETMSDGRLLLQIKDTPFDQPILAKFTSDGTIKMLSYLIVLHDPNPPSFVGIEEPENYLHPRLLPGLAEECREASGRSQLLITTHSPFFVNGMKASETWLLYREDDGFTRIIKTSSIKGVDAMMQNGAELGYLWMDGFFKVSDPIINSGKPLQKNLTNDTK
jgi:predicted ATPase